MKIIKRHQPCPSCPSSDAYCEYEDGHGYCFSCGYFKPKDKEEFLNDNYTYEYLSWRGVSKETMRRYGVKTKINSEGKPVALGFVYKNGAVKGRKLDASKSEAFYSTGEISKAGLFGVNAFSQGGARYVTITEGELDALSLNQALGGTYPVVSVQSASTAVRDCILDREYLNSFERIYLAFDSDGPGQDASRGVAQLFDYNKLYHVKFTKHKDANAYLTAEGEEELKKIWWNSRRFQPADIKSTNDEFEDILRESPKVGAPYPFPTLNEMTYGIRTGESVLITAMEGVGKTELMHAIEFTLLKETNHAVGAIFLEEPQRRHLQALAGLQLQAPVHLPDSSCSLSEVVSALKQVLPEDDRLHVYSHFGSDDPDVLLDTIRYLVTARSCRYVLLDHLSMVVSGLAGEDERKALDYISTRLEMMVKELDFALILVSHVNDEGMTRGSRYISKVADMRIDVVRNVKAPDPDERNTLYLTISKNRFSGKTGPAGRLRFDPSTFTMKEISNELPTNTATFERNSSSS